MGPRYIFPIACVHPGRINWRGIAQTQRAQQVSPLSPSMRLAPLKLDTCLLDLGLQAGGSAVRHINVEFDLLALAREWMPGHHFVLARRHVLDLE